MHALFVFAVVIAAVVAKPHPGQYVVVSQDTLGNYNLKYNVEGISRVENRDVHGIVDGGYSYIDPHGVLRKITFTSGEHGFHALGSDIPVPVRDTPEVAHARAEHLAILRAAELSATHHIVPEVVQIPIVTPVKVLEIPDVHILRSEHISSVPVVPLVHHAVPESPEALAVAGHELTSHVTHH